MAATCATGFVATTPAQATRQPRVIAELSALGTTLTLPDSMSATGISCTSALDCTLAGWMSVGGSKEPAYLNEVNGALGEPTALPVDTGGGTLSAVSCFNDDSCVAVGTEPSTGCLCSSTTTLTETESNGTWTSGGGSYGALSDVSCTGVGDCTAVGNSANNPGYTAPLAENESAGVWGADPQFNDYFQGVMNGLNCWQPLICTASGLDFATGGAAFLATETSSGWAMVTPPSDFSANDATLYCPAQGTCTAVGGDGSPVIDSEVSGVWGPPVHPDPSLTSGSFTAMSCVSAGNCTAIGSGPAGPIVAAERGGTWGPVEQLGGPSGITTITCGTSNDGEYCTALGPTFLERLTFLTPPRTLKVTPMTGALSLSWGSATTYGGLPITGYIVVASYQKRTFSCVTASHSCTLADLPPTLPLNVSVRAESAAGSGPTTMLPSSIYADAAATLRDRVIPLVVRTGVPFAVLAYGATPGSTITLGVPSSKRTCTADSYGQCWATTKIHDTGDWTAVAESGNRSALFNFYAPRVTLPFQVTKGASVVMTISSAAPESPITEVIGGVSHSTTASSSGAATIRVKATAVGVLTVNVTIHGTEFGPYNVDVT